MLSNVRPVELKGSFHHLERALRSSFPGTVFWNPLSLDRVSGFRGHDGASHVFQVCPFFLAIITAKIRRIIGG